MTYLFMYNLLIKVIQSVLGSILFLQRISILLLSSINL